MSLRSFIVDVEKCSGCGLCVIACKDEHVASAYEPWTKPQPATGHFWMNLTSRETGKLPKVSVSHMPIMYRFALMALKSKGLAEKNIYMSLERRMKCGVGKCGHCQINSSYVCQDGPVYNYLEIKSLQEAL